MFSIYKTIHPPTSIEHAVWSRFITPLENNLILSSANHIYVYRINNHTTQFECLHTFILWGNICTITPCRIGSLTKDTLFLSFMDAKLSLIEFDSTIQDLKTLSMHYFEDELAKEGQWFNFSPPIVRVDPDMRCACMLIYNSKLVIIPFFSQLDREIITNDTIPSTAGVTPGGTRQFSLSSYIVHLKKLDASLTGRIIDLQFLHSYYEPTLFILCESSRTWVGRVAVKKDTCSSVALSINVAQKSNPVIWPVDKLPFDCLSCLSVPKPIGGILVLATNSIIYLNQSIPAYGVALNTMTRDSTKYPLRPLYDLKIALDLAEAIFIANDKVLISIKSGDVYLLTLHTDTMRTMKEFTFDRIGSTVLCSCLCKCDDNFIFFGSRLGNSLLLRLNEKAIIDPTSIDTIETMNGDENETNETDFYEQPETLSESLNKIDLTETDMDIIVPNNKNDTIFFSSEFGTNESKKQSYNYSFEYCDNLINIGPCGYAIVGEGDSEEARLIQRHIPPQYQTTQLDFVTTSGTNKCGSVSILQQTIKPELVTTQALPGSIDMWTVYSSIKEQEQKSEHSFILISQETSTLIFQTGIDITELEQGGFLTNEQTIYCGNIGEQLIVQITRLHIVLLRDSAQIQMLSFENNPIRFATSLDRYLAILTTHGVIHIYLLSQDNNEQPKLIEYCKLNDKKYTCINLYVDQSGLFTTTVNNNIYSHAATSNSPKHETIQQKMVSLPTNPLDSAEFTGGDDEDEWLYGAKTTEKSATVIEPMDSSSNPPPTTTNPSPTVNNNNNNDSTNITPITRWLIAISKDGTLTMHELMLDETIPPILKFEISRFNSALKILIDIQDTNPPMTNYLGKIETSCSAYVYELLVIGLGPKKDRVYLIARIDEDLILYEVFPYQYLPEDRLKLRFHRITCNALVRTKKSSAKKNAAKRQKDAAAQLQQNQAKLNVNSQELLSVQTDLLDDEMNEYQRMLLRPFNNIANHSGVFICGTHPYWLIWSKGNLRSFPMNIDGPIKTFAEFNNANCRNGYLYFNQRDDLRISIMPSKRILDTPWPLQKIPFKQTVHFLCYHVESKLYAATISTNEFTHTLVQPSGEDRESIIYQKEANFLLPSREQFFVQLYSAIKWESIPNARLTMNEWEHVTCMKTIALRFQGNLMKTYIAVGTANCFNEDVVSRGRVILFDIIEVVPEVNQPLTKHKLKIVHDREEKGPVTAVDSILGYLVAAVGQKVYIWQYQNNSLKGIAFVDIQIYCHRMVTIKNYILIGDVHKSIALLRYQEDMRVLSYVSRDSRQLDVFATDFFIDQSHIQFVATDSDRNMYIYAHAPTQKETQGGQWLLRKSDFHIGYPITSTIRMLVNVNHLTTKQNFENKQTLLMPTLDGAIGCLVPLNEKIFRRLAMLQNSLTTMFPQYGGLNPKSFRICKTRRKQLDNPQKNTLDGDILWRYFDLSFIERNELLSRLGMQSDQFHEDLTDIARAVTLF
ncbi:unnamed protein product [Adineta steineri]|uniref:Cleavage and polyadenylation specificity factor subunit 1 n=1 Tax=Adineta steineri TaxID=433720 RepID=A0A813X7N9_9BILA|nr:unnamed protein product [Adineta steineri]CAF4115191.1 unnamed protein product [Adineta steineri]